MICENNWCLYLTSYLDSLAAFGAKLRGQTVLECNAQICRMQISWELVRHANTQSLSQTCWVALCTQSFNKPLWWFWPQSSFVPTGSQLVEAEEQLHSDENGLRRLSGGSHPPVSSALLLCCVVINNLIRSCTDLSPQPVCNLCSLWEWMTVLVAEVVTAVNCWMNRDAEYYSTS